MATAFQLSAFQSSAFQIVVVQPDSGLLAQTVDAYLGPTLGWVRVRVLPARITSGLYASDAFQPDAFQPDTFQATALAVDVKPGDSVILLSSVAGTPMVVNLPDVEAWVLQPSYQPYDPINRAIWIKDLNGNATLNPITITPFGSQTIDGQPLGKIASNRGIMRLYPLFDFTGWFIDGP